MKILGIGDIHGRSDWKKILDQEKDYDKVVFIGDYFDSFDIPGLTQISNFKDILKFKSDNLDKVVLLIGNHDYHYLGGVNERYSGYQGYLRFEIEMILEDNKSLLQMCYQHDNFIFTHAGISKDWYDNSLMKFFSSRGIDCDEDFIEKKINLAFSINPKLFGFTPGPRRDQYGDETCQSPLWIRPESLKNSLVDDSFQVIGHTSGPLTIDGKVINIDSLGYGRYLILDNGSTEIGKFY